MLPCSKSSLCRKRILSITRANRPLIALKSVTTAIRRKTGASASCIVEVTSLLGMFIQKCGWSVDSSAVGPIKKNHTNPIDVIQELGM